MAKKAYDLAVKLGEYTDKSGAKKGRWQNVGAVMESDDGSKFIMLAKWFNPAGVQDLSGKGGESILLSMFVPKDQVQEIQQAPAQSAHNQTKASGYVKETSAIFSDDTPF